MLPQAVPFTLTLMDAIEKALADELLAASECDIHSDAHKLLEDVHLIVAEAENELLGRVAAYHIHSVPRPD